jgi:hypothetical protein
VAVTKFSRELGHRVSESTVRNVKSAYLLKLKSEKAFPAISWLCRMLPRVDPYSFLKTLKLMDAKIDPITKTLNIMDANFSGFTVVQLQH